MRKRWTDIASIALFLVVLGLTGISVYKIISTIAPDFNVLWLGAKDLPTSQNPYLNPLLPTGLGYPPNTLVFYLPLIHFSYKAAQAIFVFLSFTSIVGAVYLSLKIALNNVPWRFFLIGLSLTLLSFPAKFTLGMGQSNAVALFLLLVAFYFYLSKRWSFSGTFLGLAVILKPVFAFLLLFFALKRAWRVLGWTLFPLAISVVLLALIADIELFRFWATEVIPPLLNLEGREIYFNQGIMGFVSRLTDDIAFRSFIGGGLSLLFVAVASFFALKMKDESLKFSFFLTTLLLIDTLSWQHHFVWLIFPFVLLSTRALKRKQASTLVLLAISYLLVSFNFKDPATLSVFPQSLLLSNTFYGALILLFVNTPGSSLQRKSFQNKLKYSQWASSKRRSGGRGGWGVCGP